MVRHKFYRWTTLDLDEIFVIFKRIIRIWDAVLTNLLRDLQKLQGLVFALTLRILAERCNI